MKEGNFRALSGANLKSVLLAGTAGGLVEILWVALYASVTPLSGLHVAREVTVSVFGYAAGGAWAATLGIVIHMALALAIALAFALVLWNPLRRAGGKLGVLAGSLLVLAGIWAMNFFVLLPTINPAFVALMPLAVTFASKAMFGICMGVVLAGAGERNTVARAVRAPAHIGHR